MPRLQKRSPRRGASDESLRANLAWRRAGLDPRTHRAHGLALHADESVGRERLACVAAAGAAALDGDERRLAALGELTRLAVCGVLAGIVLVVHPEKRRTQFLEAHGGEAGTIAAGTEHGSGQDDALRERRIHACSVVGADRALARADESPVGDVELLAESLDERGDVGAVAFGLAEHLAERAPLIGRRVQDSDEDFVVQPFPTRAHEEIAGHAELQCTIFLAQLHDPGMARKKSDAVLESLGAFEVRHEARYRVAVALCDDEPRGVGKVGIGLRVQRWRRYASES